MALVLLHFFVLLSFGALFTPILNMAWCWTVLATLRQDWNLHHFVIVTYIILTYCPMHTFFNPLVDAHLFSYDGFGQITSGWYYHGQSRCRLTTIRPGGCSKFNFQYLTFRQKNQSKQNYSFLIFSSLRLQCMPFNILLLFFVYKN